MEARLCRALDLAVAVVTEFGGIGYTDAEVPALSFGPEKVVAEAAMLAYAASESSDSDSVRAQIDSLARLLIPYVRSRRALADIALHPSRAFKYAVPHVLLGKLGFVDQEADQCFRSGCVRAVRVWNDLPPSALLERRWVTRLWGWDLSANQVGTSHFEYPLDVLSDSREDAYAFTHQLFYLTDFGRRQDVTLGRPVTDLLADVEALLLRAIDTEDYDVAGELLMSWPELRAAWSPAATFAFRVLARVEDEVGVLPCGNVDPARLSRLEGPERTRYARATSYHTAFVMGFLCAVILRAGALPSTGLMNASYPDGAWQPFWRDIDHSQGHWQESFGSASRSDQNALTSVVGRLAIAQQLRRHDYAALSSMLAAATHIGISDPLSGAALDRMQAINSAIGVGH